jgi:hypothetical protein
MLGKMDRPTQPYTDDLPQRHPRLTSLCSLWHSKRRDAALPDRGSLDAFALRSWACNLATIGVTGTKLRIESYGAAVIYLVGGDYSGRLVEDCVWATDRDAVLAPFRACIAQKEPVFTNAVYVRPHTSRTFVHRLYLPCADDGKTVDTVFAALYGLEQHGDFTAAEPDHALNLT